MLFTLYVSLIAYCLGAIPFGLITTQIMGKADPRTNGSGNIGATNITRLAGKTAGIVTLCLDTAKGWISMSLALGYFGPSWQSTIVGIAVLLGHCYSIYLNFKGGKGVATALGIFLAISPLACLQIIFLWIVVVRLSGYSSLGSIASCCIAAPILFLNNPTPIIIISVFASILILWRHRKNINQLITF